MGLFIAIVLFLCAGLAWFAERFREIDADVDEIL